MTRLLLTFPTRNRPEAFLRTLRRAVELVGCHALAVPAVDDDDAATAAVLPEARTVCESAGLSFSLAVGPPIGKHAALNRGFSDHEWDVGFAVPDDWDPAPGFGARMAADVMREFPDTDGAVYYDDGIQGERLSTHPVVGRRYFDRFGYYLCPVYGCLWADNEFHAVATGLGKLRFMPGSIGRHAHHSLTGHKDEMTRRDDASFAADRELFLRRQAAGFPPP